MMKHAREVLILWVLVGLIVSLFPPSNLLLVLTVIALISLSFGLAVKPFMTHKYAVFSFLAIFIALTLRALNLFDTINILLAISFLAAVFILIK